MRRMFTMLCWTWSANHFELKKWTQNTIEWTCDSFSREVSNTTTSASFSDYVICQFVKSGATVLFYNPGQVKHKFSFFPLSFRNNQPHTHAILITWKLPSRPPTTALSALSLPRRTLLEHWTVRYRFKRFLQSVYFVLGYELKETLNKWVQMFPCEGNEKVGKWKWCES